MPRTPKRVGPTSRRDKIAALHGYLEEIAASGCQYAHFVSRLQLPDAPPLPRLLSHCPSCGEEITGVTYHIGEEPEEYRRRRESLAYWRQVNEQNKADAADGVKA